MDEFLEQYRAWLGLLARLQIDSALRARFDLSDQREALVLQYWHGLTIAEIASHLGRTKSAVAGLLKWGLARLREGLRGLAAEALE